MKLDELRSSGGIVSDDPVKRHVVWGTGDKAVEFDVLIVPMSFGVIEGIYADDEQHKGAAMIAASVRLGDDGQERITYADACHLKPDLATALLGAVTAVNDITEGATKN